MKQALLVIGSLVAFATLGCAEGERPGLCVEVAEDVSSFEACAATDVSCTFWFQTEGPSDEVTCDELCAGTRCAAAFDGTDQTPCILGPDIACDDPIFTGVCECVGSP